MVRVTTLGVIGCMVVAGCSGGSGGSGAGVADGVTLPPDPAPRGFEELQAEQAGLESAMAGVGLTDPSDLPTSGATYEGVMTLISFGEVGFPQQMSGDLQIVAEFDDSEVAAQATNFAGYYLPGEPDQAIEGTLTFTGGTIDRGVDSNGDGSTFSMDEAAGSVVTADGTTYAVQDGEMVGDFRGEDHQFAQGDQRVVFSAGNGRGALTDGMFAVAR